MPSAWALRWDDGTTLTRGLTEEDGKGGEMLSIRSSLHRFLQDLETLVALKQREKRTLTQYTTWAKALEPLFGRKLQDLTVQEIRVWHRQCAVQAARSKTPNRKDGTVTANRCLMILSLVYRHAEEDGLIPLGSSPVSRVKNFRETPRREYLTPRELAALWRAVSSVERLRHSTCKHVDRAFVDSTPQVIRLLLLLALRKEEAINLKWSEVDFEMKVLRLPDTKIGYREVAISTFAMPILRKQRQRHPDSPFVFPSRGGDRPLSDLYRVWKRCKVLAGLGDREVVPHTARHSFASLELKEGTPLEHVMRVLGHRNPNVTLNTYGRPLATPGSRASVERHGARFYSQEQPKP